jgi:hypothetical protein
MYKFFGGKECKYKITEIDMKSIYWGLRKIFKKFSGLGKTNLK